MIKISKAERDYLESKGFEFGDVLHKTYGHKTTYYMTETRKSKAALEEYRHGAKGD